MGNVKELTTLQKNIEDFEAHVTKMGKASDFMEEVKQVKLELLSRKSDLDGNVDRLLTKMEQIEAQLPKMDTNISSLEDNVEIRIGRLQKDVISLKKTMSNLLMASGATIALVLVLLITVLVK
ncbi:hypothetical protein [Bacillus alkalicellulosilyticus]|uniref:hypothetical protein n=1 Tax=Alkalihalobacterium alkalicellulosilyticum TaxID=1912214 RepID=UPI000998CC05|nr:hypothetical protein [Bacillus alkalicellulosilyticus]